MHIARHPSRDVDADSPGEISSRGWFQIAKRIVKALGEDHVTLVAAGVAFYTFLAIFPALSAFISLYGLVVTPQQASMQMAELTGIMPEQAREMLNGIVVDLASRSEDTLGLTLLVSLALSIWSANKATDALFEGLNIVYNERDERSFIRRKLLTLSFTLGGILGAIFALVLIVGISAFLDMFGLPTWLEMLIQFLRWPLLAAAFVAGLAVAYKVAPDRDDPRFRWVSVGSIVATLLWLAVSVGFSVYVSNFGSYDEVYGSLAAVVIMLLWLFLTTVVVLVGAEINAEAEHQTARDTTVGPDRPLGSRDAYYADHVAGGR